MQNANKQKSICLALTVCLYSVPVKILYLRDPEPQHHWCVPFSVDSNPPATINWLYNNSPLIENLYAYTELIRDASDGSVQHGCLFLNKPTHLNNGYYTLIVINKLGRDEATVNGTFMENPFDSLDPEGIILGKSSSSKHNVTFCLSYFSLTKCNYFSPHDSRTK